EAPLVAVVELPEEVDVAGVGDEARGHHRPQRVARGLLDLYHVGAPVAEDRATRWDEPVLGELHHPDPVQYSHRDHLRSDRTQSDAPGWRVRRRRVRARRSPRGPRRRTPPPGRGWPAR